MNDFAFDRSSPAPDSSVRNPLTDPPSSSLGGSPVAEEAESERGTTAHASHAERASAHGSMQENATALGSGAGRNLDPEAATERLKRLRERSHDVTAARALFRRGPGAATEPGRSNNP